MSAQLKDVEWSEFVLGTIFNISATKSSIDKKKLRTEQGVTPYITRSEKSNGIDFFVCEQEQKYIKDNKNVITIGLDTQTVFYQPHAFYTGQNIQILANESLNGWNAKFLIPLIKRQLEKFSWGGNGATLSRLRRSKIVLPINASNEPDYAFMEQYMHQKEQEKLAKYHAYIRKRLGTKIEFEVVPQLSKKAWGEFFIEDVFYVKAGKRLTKSDMNVGAIPFIGASDSNNGITAFISNKNSSFDQNVLGVNYNGSVVENFYHPYQALFSDDVKRLSFKNVDGNRFLYIFAKAMILQQKCKYQYAYKFNETRMLRQKILLPVNANGEPDYPYMENYAKNLEFEKLSVYAQKKKLQLSQY